MYTRSREAIVRSEGTEALIGRMGLAREYMKKQGVDKFEVCDDVGGVAFRGGGSRVL